MIDQLQIYHLPKELELKERFCRCKIFSVLTNTFLLVIKDYSNFYQYLIVETNLLSSVTKVLKEQSRLKIFRFEYIFCIYCLFSFNFHFNGFVYPDGIFIININVRTGHS